MTTEDRIKKTALTLFLEKGFERTSIRDIALKAKINIALLNYYFRSKENLFNSIFSTLLEKYTPTLNGILGSSLPIEEKIHLYVEEYIDILLENPKLTYFVLSVLHRNPDKITQMKIFQSLYNTGDFSKQFAEEVRKGNIKDVDPTQFFINMLSLITFPFTIKQVIMEKNHMNEDTFKQFMHQRKQVITDMLLLTIKK